MSCAELAIQLDEHIASSAASLAGGLWSQGAELYGLLIAANRSEDAAWVEQAFAAASIPEAEPTAVQAELQTAQRALAEQICVSIIIIERLLDHRQLQAIDNALLVQFRQQCEQIAALLLVLDQSDFSVAVAQIAAQLDQRSRELDQRIHAVELTSIANLLAALQVVLARRYGSEPLEIAVLSPATQSDLTDIAKTVAAQHWRGGQYG